MGQAGTGDRGRAAAATVPAREWDATAGLYQVRALV
jgi:hypothetical protein